MDSAFMPKADPSFEYVSKMQYPNYKTTLFKISTYPRFRLFVSDSFMNSEMSFSNKVFGTLAVSATFAGALIYNGTRIWGLRRIERRWLRVGVALFLTWIPTQMAFAYIELQREYLLSQELTNNAEGYRRYKLTGDIKALLRKDLK